MNHTQALERIRLNINTQADMAIKLANLAVSAAPSNPSWSAALAGIADTTATLSASFAEAYAVLRDAPVSDSRRIEGCTDDDVEEEAEDEEDEDEEDEPDAPGFEEFVNKAREYYEGDLEDYPFVKQLLAMVESAIDANDPAA